LPCLFSGRLLQVWVNGVNVADAGRATIQAGPGWPGYSDGAGGWLVYSIAQHAAGEAGVRRRPPLTFAAGDECLQVLRRTPATA
jgi:hypothetical protein